MQITSAEELGKLIRDARKSQKVTQLELAGASGTGLRFIRELERGKSTCELGKALLVLSMLGIKLEALMPDLEKPDV